MAFTKITDPELEACIKEGLKPYEIAERYGMTSGAVTRRIDILGVYKGGAFARYAKEFVDDTIECVHTTTMLHRQVYETALELRDEREEYRDLKCEVRRAIQAVAGPDLSTKKKRGRPKEDEESAEENSDVFMRLHLIDLLNKFIGSCPDPALALVKLTGEDRSLMERYEAQLRLALDVESLQKLVDTLVSIYEIVDESVRMKITTALLSMPTNAGRAILGYDRYSAIEGVARPPKPDREITLPPLLTEDNAAA